MTPEILFKDDNFAVISKPAGMIVNNADTAKDVYTLQDFVKEKFTLSGNIESEFFKRGGIVHRLDKETSGVIIVALNEESFLNLQKQFKERTVKKEYIALCHGKMDEGHINVPIGRLPWNRKRFGVIPKGRESYTKFRLIKKYLLPKGKSNEELSLVNVFPKTGRTHQIRVHFQYIGHPIFADSLYSGRKTYVIDKKFLTRQFLHASKIKFISPTNGTEVEFEARLPSELEDFLKKLR